MSTRAAAANPKAAMSMEEMLDLPVAFPLVTAARAFGIGRSTAYQLALKGQFPCKVLRVGNAYRVTRTELFRALDIETPSVDQASRPGAGGLPLTAARVGRS